MAYTSTFYLNGPTLSSATAVFTNSGMTTCAPNGYYSDGVIVRQQVDCVLLPQQTCNTCGISCDSIIATSGTTGLYEVNIDAGSSLGAIIVKFDPLTIPDGIKALFNSATYNKLSSPNFGYIAGADILGPTYTGLTSSACAIQTAGGTISLTKYLYDGTSFVNTGSSESVIVTTSQVVTKASAVGDCVMVIPKVAASPSVINLLFYGVCSTTAFNVNISCPALLPSFTSTVRQATEPTGAICSVPLNQTYYFAKVHTAVDTYVGLYDWVFSDPYGGNVLPDGWYRINNLAAPNDTIRVQNGVVVTLYDKCP